jgi:hypothetical protein
MRSRDIKRHYAVKEADKGFEKVPLREIGKQRLCAAYMPLLRAARELEVIVGVGIAIHREHFIQPSQLLRRA